MLKRKRYSAKFKSEVALEALKEQRTLADLSSHFGLHANQISQWKKQLLEGSSEIFLPHKKAPEQDWEKEKEALFAQIGKLQMELEWLKKKYAILTERKG